MKKSIILFLFCLLCSVSSFGQSWDWGKDLSVLDDPTAKCVAADSKGNAYLGGSGNSFSFLVKYDSLGNRLWLEDSHSPGSNFWGSGTVAADDSDNVYIGGGFMGTSTWGTITLTSSNLSESTFLIKYNSNGTAIWGAESWNTMGKDAQINGIATDDSANVYVAGYFMDSVGFGPFKFQNTSGSSQLFIVKYASNGNVVWAKVSYGDSYNSSWAQAYAITCDKMNYIDITGNFNGNLYIGRDTLTNTKSMGMFLLRFDRNGNLIWCNEGKDGIGGMSVVDDRYANTYVTGYFNNTATIGGMSLSSPCGSANSAYLAKFNSHGNLIWVKTSSCGWSGWGISSDTNDVIYISGGSYPSRDTINFCNAVLNTNAAKDAAFFLKLDTAGNSLSKVIIRTGGDDNNTIVSSPEGKYVFVGGDIYDTITFDTNFLNNNNQEVPFIARWGNPANTINTNTLQIYGPTSSISLFPNPNNGQFNLVIASPSEGGTWQSQSIVEVYNELGQQVFIQTLHSVQGDNNINLSNQPNGIYLYRVITQTGSLIGEGKLIIAK